VETRPKIVICAAHGCRKHAATDRREPFPREFCGLLGSRVVIFRNWLTKGLPNGRSFDGDRAHLEPFPWSPV
jgi:hypothetical protein